MSNSATFRRAVAELRSGADRPAWSLIGGRSIHQYWHLLSPHFRAVLLAPQRRPDGGGVSWSWREASANSPLTAAELADVRQRLKSAGQALAGHRVEHPRSDGHGEGEGALDLGAEVGASVQAMLAILVAAPDSALAGFVCRTETGLMVHSWGGKLPALPYYPDTLECQISGTVLMPEEGAGGLTLVIENRQGAVVARIQTDATGNFCFQKIVPGNYRIRVTDRGDFPATGFAVAVERESVVGLELHRGTAVATFANPASRASRQSGAAGGDGIQTSAAPRVPFLERVSRLRWRRMGLAFALLVFGAAGAGWWVLARRPEGSANPARPPRTSSPAAASGTLTDGSAAADSPRSGGEAGSSRGAAFAVALSHAATSGVAPPTSTGSTNAGRVPGPTAEVLSPADAPALAPAVSSPDSPPEIRSAGIAPLTVDQRKSVVPDLAANPPGEAEPADDPDDSVSGPGTPMAPVALESARGSPAARKDARPPVVTRRHQPAEEPAQASSPPTAPNSAAGEPIAPASLDRNGSGRASGANVRPTGTAFASGALPTGAEFPAAALAAGPAGDLDSPAADAPPATAPATTTARPAPSRADATSARARAPAQQPAESPEARDETLPAAPSPTKSKAAARGKKPRASPAPAVTAPTPSVEGRVNSLADVITPSGARPPADENPAAGRLGQHLRVQVSAWERRLVRDSILPTHPVPEGQDDAVEIARGRLLAERRAQLPLAFRQLVTTGGFALEFSRDDVGPDQAPAWRDALGAEPVGARVGDNRAEVIWPDVALGRQSELALVCRDGRELARVGVDPEGAFVLKTTADVRCWYWVGVECEGEPESGATRAGPRPRFEWLLLAGAPVPLAWRRDDNWRGGRGYRIDVPVQAGDAGQVSFALALVDPATGWAITCDTAVTRP